MWWCPRPRCAGTQLAKSLLHRGTLCGSPLRRVVLCDVVAPSAGVLAELEEAGRAHGGGCAVIPSVGPLDGIPVAAVGDASSLIVFHLASSMSGDCEADPIAGWMNNVENLRKLLEVRNLPSLGESLAVVCPCVL